MEKYQKNLDDYEDGVLLVDEVISRFKSDFDKLQKGKELIAKEREVLAANLQQVYDEYEIMVREAEQRMVHRRDLILDDDNFLCEVIADAEFASKLLDQLLNGPYHSRLFNRIRLFIKKLIDRIKDFFKTITF